MKNQSTAPSAPGGHSALSISTVSAPVRCARLFSVLAMALLTSTLVGAAEKPMVADDFTRPKLNFDASLSIPDKGANLIRVFLPSGTVDFGKLTSLKSVFYEPPIFMATEYGRLKAAVGDDNSVTLHFLWDDDAQATKMAIRQHVADVQAQLEVADAQAQLEVADTQTQTKKVPPGIPPIGQINIIPFDSGRFHASTNESIRSQLIDGDLASSTGELHAVFPFADRASAEAFVSDLHRELGGTQLVFRYQFEGVRDVRCTASVTYSDIDEYSRGIDASGEGSEGFVSRHEMISAIRNVVSRRDIDSRCADSELAAMLIDSVGAKLAELDHDAIAINADLTRYREDDFKADVVRAEKLIENEVTRLIEDVHEASSAETGGQLDYSTKANVLGILEGGMEAKVEFIHARTELSRELADRLAKYGITTEFAGTKFLPKTMSLYSRGDIRQRLSESVTKTLTVPHADGNAYRILVGKPNWLPTQSVPLKDIVALRKRVRELEEALSYEDRGRTRLLQAKDLTYRDRDRTRVLDARDLTYKDGDRRKQIKGEDLSYKDGDGRRAFDADKLTYRIGERRRMVDGDVLMRAPRLINIEAYNFHTTERKRYVHRTGVSTTEYPYAWPDVLVSGCNQWDVMVHVAVATSDKSKWIIHLAVDTGSDCDISVYVAYVEDALLGRSYRRILDVSGIERIRSQ